MSEPRYEKVEFAIGGTVKTTGWICSGAFGEAYGDSQDEALEGYRWLYYLPTAQANREGQRVMRPQVDYARTWKAIST